MCMAAILVMWPQLLQQIWVPLTHEGSICDLTAVCPVASGQKLFETRASVYETLCPQHMLAPKDGQIFKGPWHQKSFTEVVQKLIR